MELQHLGLNAITIGLVGTIFFTWLQFWGLLKQSKKIWRVRSGTSLSVSFFTFGMCGYIAGFLKGLSSGSIAMSFNMIMPIAMLPILVGLWKFNKGFSKTETLVIAGLIVAIILDVILPFKDQFWFWIALAQSLSMILQPIEMIKKKSAGVIEIKMIMSFYVGNWFWVIYSFAVKDESLEIVTIAVATMYTIIFLVWWNYKDVLPRPKLQLARYD